MSLSRVPSSSRRAIGLSLLAVITVAASGCSLLGGKKHLPTQYLPETRVQADPSWPSVDWQLELANVQVAHPYDSLRIAVRPSPQELQVYQGATWAQRPGDMIANTLLRTLEDSGRIRGVARAGSGVTGDYRLLLDVRRFESDYAGAATPSATIEINAKLLGAKESNVVASRTFVEVEPVGGTDVPQVVEAFNRALTRIDRDIAGWTLASGSPTVSGRRSK